MDTTMGMWSLSPSQDSAAPTYTVQPAEAQALGTNT